jgi:hypothetical protein
VDCYGFDRIAGCRRRKFDHIRAIDTGDLVMNSKARWDKWGSGRSLKLAS